jgi:hypothetical protein
MLRVTELREGVQPLCGAVAVLQFESRNRRHVLLASLEILQAHTAHGL